MDISKSFVLDGPMSLLTRKQHINAIALKCSRLSRHLRKLLDSCRRNICTSELSEHIPQLEPLNWYEHRHWHTRLIMKHSCRWLGRSTHPSSSRSTPRKHRSFARDVRASSCEKCVRKKPSILIIIGITISITTALISLTAITQLYRAGTRQL